MKLIKLHSKPTVTVYKNQICSLAAAAVLLIFVATLVIPILFALWVNSSWTVGTSVTIFEQPNIEFQHRFIFIGDTNDENLIACSTFPYFNALTIQQPQCHGFKFWQKDSNHDHQMDKASFEVSIRAEKLLLRSFDFVLFFEGTLKHKCVLKPPAILIQHLEISDQMLYNSEITIKAHLKLFQNTQLVCPFFGRTVKTHFRNELLLLNASRADDFRIRKIREEIETNPAYFKAEIIHTNFRRHSGDETKVIFNLEVDELAARYTLNIWEQLAHLWLYFISFFVVAYYVANRIKNFLFSRHLLRSWEIIPWKKLH